jgi:hypothetical protein
MSVRITCITKDDTNNENRYTAISELGWKNESTGNTGRASRLEMYNWIKFKGGSAYVKDSSNNTAYLMTAETNRGTQYVKTIADETKTDNLLSLPRC